MLRRIIKIDEDACNGCGICAEACHEGAIGMVEGKARLLRDDYCDGLGDCLPACPTGAISFEEREAAAYDEAAVMANMAKKGVAYSGCPGSNAQVIQRNNESPTTEDVAVAGKRTAEVSTGVSGQDQTQYCQPLPESQLMQWPVQIKLVPINAPYFDGARLLIAADCCAYAYARFHERFIKNHITLIGCPKLDGTDYSEKLGEIIRQNDIKSVTVVRMEVPCCGGIEQAVKNALSQSGKMIPWQVVVVTTDGQIVEA